MKYPIIEKNRTVVITPDLFRAEMEKLKANGSITMRPETKEDKLRNQKAQCMARLRAERKGQDTSAFPKRIRCRKQIHRKRITSLIFTALAIRKTAGSLLAAVEIAMKGLK